LLVAVYFAQDNLFTKTFCITDDQNSVSESHLFMQLINNIVM